MNEKEIAGVTMDDAEYQAIANWLVENYTPDMELPDRWTWVLRDMVNEQRTRNS